MSNIAYYDIIDNSNKEVFKYCNRNQYLQICTKKFFIQIISRCDLFIFHDNGRILYPDQDRRIRAIIDSRPDEQLTFFGNMFPKNKSVILEVTDGNDTPTIRKVDTDDGKYFFYALIPRISSLGDEKKIKSLINALIYEENALKAIELFYESIYKNEHPENLIDLSTDMQSHLNQLEEIFKSNAIVFPKLWLIGKIARLSGINKIDSKEYKEFFNNYLLTFREVINIQNALEKYNSLVDGKIKDVKELCDLSKQQNPIDKVEHMKYLEAIITTDTILLICSSDIKLGDWAFKMIKQSEIIPSKIMLVASVGVIRSNWSGWQRESQSIQVIQKIKKKGLKVVPLDLDYECSIFFTVEEGKESPLLQQWKELLAEKCLSAIRLDSFLSNDQQPSEHVAQVGFVSSGRQGVEAIGTSTADGKIRERFINTMVTIGH